MPRVIVQVIKVYEIDVEDCDDPIQAVYDMQSTQIEDEGKLIDVTTDNAEIQDEE
jgi:hypothetical protein